AMNRRGQRSDRVDRTRDVSAEWLRRDVDAAPAPLRALPFERLVLHVLVEERLDHEPARELAPPNQLEWRRRAEDRVVVRAGDRLVDSTSNDELRRNQVERLTCGVADGR